MDVVGIVQAIGWLFSVVGGAGEVSAQIKDVPIVTTLAPVGPGSSSDGVPGAADNAPAQ